MVEIKEMLAPKGSKCRPGYALKATYITIHNTANTNAGAGAENHGKYLQGGGKSNTVSWHYAVDDKLIVRCIPENEAAWHAGDGGKGTGNRNSLAIEICEKMLSFNRAAITSRLQRMVDVVLNCGVFVITNGALSATRAPLAIDWLRGTLMATCERSEEFDESYG